MHAHSPRRICGAARGFVHLVVLHVAVAVLLPWLVAGTDAAMAISSPPPAHGTICVLDGHVRMSSHEYYAATVYHRARFPLTNWTVKVLPSYFSARTTVRAFVVDGADCDTLHGALSSTVCLALSPLVETRIAWVDAGATSTELSDVAAHPAFNRVAPTTDLAMIALSTFATAMNWTTMTVLCDNIAVGRGMAESFGSAYLAAGGQITMSRCVEAGASSDDIAQSLDDIESSSAGSRIMFVAATRPAQEEDVLFRTIAARRTHERVQVLLSPENCVDSLLRLFPGAACVVTAPNDSYEDFFGAYAARDKTAERVAIVGAGRDPAVYDATPPTRGTGAYGVDAVRLAMEAFYTYPGADKTLYPTMAEYVRSISFDGVSGPIALTSNGDRRSIKFAVVNSQPVPGANASVTPPDIPRVGLIVNGSLTLSPTPADRPGRFYWFNGMYSDRAPSAAPALTATDDAAETPVWAVAVIAVVALVVVALGVALIASRVLGGQGQTYQHCPVDSSQPLVVFFVAVHGLAHLWDECDGDSVTAALEVVAKLVRSAVRDHKCHEARRLDASTFMLVAKTPEVALRCAAAITESMNVKASWATVLQARDAGGIDKGSTASRNTRRSRGVHTTRSSARSASQRSQRTPAAGPANHKLLVGGSALRRALRCELVVSVGMAHGFASIDFDPEHHVLAYHGPLLDEAAAVADTAVGGQIVVTPSVVDALEESGMSVQGSFSEYRDVAVTAAASRPAAATPADALSRARVISLRTFSPAAQEAPEGLAADIAAEVVRCDLQARTHTEDGEPKQRGMPGPSSSSSTSILGALSSAATGAATRQVGVIVVDIPALGDTQSRIPSEHTRFCQRVVGDLMALAAANRGHVHDVIGTRVIVTMNVAGERRVAQPAVAAIDAALQIAWHVAEQDDLHPTRNASGLACSVGVAAGTAVAGVTTLGAREGAHAAQTISLAAGGPLQAAALAQGASRTLGVPLVCVGVADDELRSRFHSATVDMVTTRVDGERALPVVAVTSARLDTGAEEWLYLVGTSAEAGGNSRDPEARWPVVIRAAASDSSGAPVGAAPSSKVEDASSPPHTTAPECDTEPTDPHEQDCGDKTDGADAVTLVRRVARVQLAEAEAHARPRAYAQRRHEVFATAAL